MSDPIRTENAKRLVIEVEHIVESDVMKAEHYLEMGVKVAIVGEDTEKAEELAGLLVELSDWRERFQRSFRKIVD